MKLRKYSGGGEIDRENLWAAVRPSPKKPKKNTFSGKKRRKEKRSIAKEKDYNPKAWRKKVTGRPKEIERGFGEVPWSGGGVGR